MSTARKPKAPTPEEHLEALESIRKCIRAGRLKRVAANLSEGEGVTITIRDGVRIDLI